MAKLIASLLLVTLALTILVQNTYGRSISESKSTKLNDKFAQEASDALDSTFMFFKNGFDDLINDGHKINSMLNHMSEKISNLTIRNFNKTNTSEDPSQRLRQLTLNANKTLMETL